jgi:myosin heavy subunit
MAQSQFEIKHFAGTVRYDSTGFVEKNRDKLYHHLEDLLMESSDAAFKKMMKDQVGRS